MQTQGRASIDKNDLTDIRQVKIDQGLPPVQRIAVFLDEVKNPYVLRVGDSLVQLGWAETTGTIQDRMAELFRSQYQ